MLYSICAHMDSQGAVCMFHAFYLSWQDIGIWLLYICKDSGYATVYAKHYDSAIILNSVSVTQKSLVEHKANN